MTAPTTASWFHRCRRGRRMRLFNRQSQRGRGPARGGGRNELVLAVGEAGFKVLLDRLASRDDMPGPVWLLCLEQVSHSALVNRIARVQPAGLMQGDQGRSGGV